jgi:hypothetical protein
MNARVVLGVMAVLMVSCILLSTMSTAYLFFLLGPVAIGGLVVLFLALCCGWRCGIYIFMVMCVIGLVNFGIVYVCSACRD